MGIQLVEQTSWIVVVELQCLSSDEIIKGVSDTLLNFKVRNHDGGEERKVDSGVNKSEGCILESRVKENISRIFNGVFRSH